MRKLISIALLTLVFFSQLGYHFIYSVKLIMVRKEQKWKILSTIDDAELEKVELNAQIKWKEEGREFYFQGQLYDVVKKKNLNGKTVYFVLNDRNEEELLAKHAHTTKKQTGNQADKKIAAQIFQQVCILDEPITATILYIKNSATRFPVRLDMHGENHRKILIPPPQG